MKKRESGRVDNLIAATLTPHVSHVNSFLMPVI